jgi:hypothetical protein
MTWTGLWDWGATHWWQILAAFAGCVAVLWVPASYRKRRGYDYSIEAYRKRPRQLGMSDRAVVLPEEKLKVLARAEQEIVSAERARASAVAKLDEQREAVPLPRAAPTSASQQLVPA